MATVTKGKTFISGETVEPADMHQLVDSATVTDIVNADIASNAAIAGSKLAAGAITDTQLATGAVTGAAGGGKIAASAITAQTVIADPLADTDEFLVHDASASALRRVAFNAMQPIGAVLQTVAAQDATYKSLTWSSNFGVLSTDTSRVVTAGAEIISAQITPSSSSNKVLVSFSIPLLVGSVTMFVQLVLFRGNTAIQAEHRYISSLESNVYPNGNQFLLDTPNTTSQLTYSLRISRAGSNTGTIYVNGNNTGRVGGGAYNAVLLLQEIKG